MPWADTPLWPDVTGDPVVESFVPTTDREQV